MVDFAALVLGGFRNDIVAVFGETAGWIIGHTILLIFAALAVVAVKERAHIMHYSGLGRKFSVDVLSILFLIALQYYIFTESFDFSAGASLGLALTSSLSIRWMVQVLG